jgi:hypothetical protein
MSEVRFALLLFLPVVLAACSAVEQRRTPAPVRDADTAPIQVPQPPPAAPEPSVQTAPYQPPGAIAPVAPTEKERPAAGGYTAPTATLVAMADQAEDRGEYGQAASSLERALRIEPRNAYLWNRLAHLRFSEGRYGEAGDLAAKSNALAGRDRALKRDNWKMVAAARRAAGDIPGARAAEQQVELLSR